MEECLVVKRDSLRMRMHFFRHTIGRPTHRAGSRQQRTGRRLERQQVLGQLQEIGPIGPAAGVHGLLRMIWMRHPVSQKPSFSAPAKTGLKPHPVDETSKIPENSGATPGSPRRCAGWCRPASPTCARAAVPRRRRGGPGAPSHGRCSGGGACLDLPSQLRTREPQEFHDDSRGVRGGTALRHPRDQLAVSGDTCMVS